MFLVRFICVVSFNHGIVSYVFYEITSQYDHGSECNYDTAVQCLNILRSVFIMIAALNAGLKVFTWQSFCEVIAAVMSVYKAAKDSTISPRFTFLSHFTSLSPKFSEPTVPASCCRVFRVILRNPALISH